MRRYRPDNSDGQEGGVWHYLGSQRRQAFGLNVSLIDPLLFVGSEV